MAESRKAYSQNLSEEQALYGKLKKTLKQLVKNEEGRIKNKEAFRAKWQEIFENERSPGIKASLLEYTRAMEATSTAHHQMLNVMRGNVSDSIAAVPIKIKTQKKLISNTKTNKSSGGRSPDTFAVAVDAIKESSDFEKRRIAEAREMMKHMINSEMHYHAVALQHFSQAFEITYAIDADKEMQNLLEPPSNNDMFNK